MPIEIPSCIYTTSNDPDVVICLQHHSILKHTMIISNFTLDFQSWDTFTPKAPGSSGDNKTATSTSGGNISEALLRKNTTSMVFGRQLKAIQVKRMLDKVAFLSFCLNFKINFRVCLILTTCAVERPPAWLAWLTPSTPLPGRTSIGDQSRSSYQVSDFRQFFQHFHELKHHSIESVIPFSLQIDKRRRSQAPRRRRYG